MSFTLAHLSDPHLAPLPQLELRDYFSKRLLGWLNWKRKRQYIHNPEILNRLVEDLQAQKPDHIAVTGDLTNLGLEEEYKNARDWLRALAEPERLSTIPGNHDAYVQGALEHGLPYLLEWIKEPFPYLQMRGEIALIHVSTAVPTLPFMATGRLGAHQLVQLADLLDDNKGKFRIVLLHHALECQEWNKRLRDSAALQDVLRSKGAELVLHGHLHCATHREIGRAQAFGVPSASTDPAFAKHPAGYALYRIDKKETGWSVEVTRRGIGKNLRFQTSETMKINF